MTGMAGTAVQAVRPARPLDAGAIAAVQARAWRTSYAGLLPEETLAALEPDVLTPSWRETVTASAGGPHTVLVATTDDIVVGFVTVGPSDDVDADPDDGLLGVLVVDPAHQRAGHASRMLSAAAQHLRELGLKRVSGWAPELDYARRTFLTSAGLVPDGARRSYLGAESKPVLELRLVADLGPGDDA